MIIFYWILAGVVCDLLMMAFITSQNDKRMARLCKGASDEKVQAFLEGYEMGFIATMKEQSILIHALFILLPPAIFLAFDIYYEEG